MVPRLNLCHQREVERERERERERDCVYEMEGGELEAYCVNFPPSLSPVGQVNSLRGDSSGAGV